MRNCQVGKTKLIFRSQYHSMIWYGVISPLLYVSLTTTALYQSLPGVITKFRLRHMDVVLLKDFQSKPTNVAAVNTFSHAVKICTCK